MNQRNQFALLFVLLSCLLIYTNAQFRIINGQNINIENRPHAVAIFHSKTYICLGSLVNLNSVVTVAHCVKPAEEHKLVLLAGVTDVDEVDTEEGQKRSVLCIYYDPNYNPVTRYMDVAVVKVDGSFQRTDAVRTILLCGDRLVPGLWMDISGWGSLEVNSRDPSPFLKTKSVQIANTQQCKTTYLVGESLNLAETIMCAGRGGQDLCIGDSGAAGVLNRRLCAVAQGGCGVSSFPDLYTDVSNLRVRNFITSKM